MKITSSITSIDSLMSLKRILSIEFLTIFEFGSRYGEDTVEFAKLNPDATIYAFECNFKTVDKCRNNVEKFNNVIFTNTAIGNTEGEIDFYSIDEKNTLSDWPDGNQGASSLLEANKSYHAEKYSQTKNTVPITTLRKFLNRNNISEISLLWMDIQGAEKMALEGLGDRLQDVKLIHLEVEFKEVYKNQPLFKEMNRYFSDNNFILLGFTNLGRSAGDAVYLNRNIKVRNILSARIYLIFRLLILKIKNYFI